MSLKSDIIDIDQEKKRLQKEIDKLSENISKVDKKLSNKKFVENAPSDVVEEQKNRKQEAEQTRDKLSRALKQIEAA